MNYETRRNLYRELEVQRLSKVLCFVTSDRQGMETRIAQDCIDLFVDLLDQIGPTQKISLILHTNGGQTLAAWRLVNLIRTFCDELEVIVPAKALSAGTLVCIGADRIVMTKQAVLGPIDPSVDSALNPQVNMGGQVARVPVSVESVRGYLDAAKTELKIKGDAALSNILVSLSSQIHPLVLGEVFRSRAQIRFLAQKLLKGQIEDQKKVRELIDFLCGDSGSHDYSINRREAQEFGLKIEKPTQELYDLLRRIHQSTALELKLLLPYAQLTVLGPANQVNYSEVRGVVESADGGCYQFVSEGTLERVNVPTQFGPQQGVSDNRLFEAWRKLQ
jgi:hypothetical protein